MITKFIGFTVFILLNTFIFHRRPNYYNYIIVGTTVENKGKLILTEIIPSVQKHDIFWYITSMAGNWLPEVVTLKTANTGKQELAG